MSQAAKALPCRGNFNGFDSRINRQRKKMYLGHTPEDGLYTVRLWDMFDGWIDIKKDLSKEEAEKLWKEKTNDGRKKVCFADGDYYAIFPADSRMIYTPEFLGR